MTNVTHHTEMVYFCELQLRRYLQTVIHDKEYNPSDQSQPSFSACFEYISFFRAGLGKVDFIHQG